MRTIPIRQWLLALCLLALVPGRSIAQGRARTTRARDQVRIRWQDQKTAQEKTVTFSARNIALQEALDIVADLTGTKVRIHGSTVMLVPRDAADDAIVVRMYNVLPNVDQQLKAVGMDLGRR